MSENKHVRELSLEEDLELMENMLNAPPIKPKPMLRLKHISHLDLDGYGATILSQMLQSVCPEGSFELELSHIIPNRLLVELEETLNHIEDYDKVMVTDLAVTQAVVDLVNNSEHKGKIQILDHHTCNAKNLPSNIVVTKISPTHEGKATCATELYYDFIKQDKVFGLIYNNMVKSAIEYFVEVVRVYDTFEFWKMRNTMTEAPITSYHDAPRLNMLFHIMERVEFCDYILEYMRTMTPETLLTANDKFMWIPKVLEMEFNKNNKYIDAAIKRLVKTPFKYNIYKDGTIHNLDYLIGVVFAEKSSPVIANTALERTPDIDICAVISNNQVSIYTNKETVDVSYIAKLFGGGGHKEAAGFTIPYVNASIFNTAHFNSMIRCAGQLANDVQKNIEV